MLFLCLVIDMFLECFHFSFALHVIDGFPMLVQVLTYNGFYDSNLEFVSLDNVQIVASMNSGNSLGRHKLTSRFTSIVRLCSVGYYALMLFGTVNFLNLAKDLSISQFFTCILPTFVVGLFCYLKHRFGKF